MAVVGVIAEYNPFHRGHAWQLAELRRRLGADTAVIACMSGNFVQRGDFAVLNKHRRAETALLGGADLVLELPTPWSAAAAERFAQGGVAVLEAAGIVTHLAFGCECGDLEPLQRIAEALESEEYHAGLRRFLDEGMTFAVARQGAIWGLTSRETAEHLSYPNNSLAVEYLRALAAGESGITPIALPRTGAAHDSGVEDAYSSASAIRGKLFAGSGWQELLPAGTASVLLREMVAGRAPVRMENCQRAVLAGLRRLEREELQPYDGGSEGMYRRFYEAVRSAASLEEILLHAKTKRYTLARLRRMLLQSYLGTPQAAQGETPPYLRVLGANERGRGLLRQMRKAALLPVLTKPAHIRRLGSRAQHVFAQEARCTDLYTLAYPELREARPGDEYTAAPVMLDL